MNNLKQLRVAAEEALAKRTTLDLDLPRGRGLRRRLAGTAGPHGTIGADTTTGQIVHFDPVLVLEFLRVSAPSVFEG